MIRALIRLLPLLACATPGHAQALAPCEPPAGCYIGAYIELDPVVKDSIPAFESLTGKKHASYFRYVGYGKPFPFEWAEKLKSIGATPHIAWEPNAGLAMVQDDSYLAGWVQACAHYGKPVLLRFASEMNGDWEAWSGDPDLYVRKWRMVYDAFYRGAPNVVMIWCPFATPKSTIPLYYPGDDYVDWVGVNAYSVVHHSGDVNQRAVDNAVEHLEFIYRLYADKKPIAVCEYAATHYCEAAGCETVDFALREMKRMYESIEIRFPRVRMINWFSVDAVGQGLAHNDYSVTTNERVLNMYRSLVSSGHFLTSIGQAPVGPLAGSVTMPGTAPAPWGTPGPEITGGAVATALPPMVGGAGRAPSGLPLALPGTGAPAVNDIAVVVRGGDPLALSGRVTVEALIGSSLQPGKVTFKLDGRFRAASTVPAFFFPWNTEHSTPGEHRVQVRVEDAVGRIIAEKEVAVIVAPR